MRVKDIPEIVNLSIPEKILFVEDLWDNITLNELTVVVPQSHVDELERRLKKYQAAPGNLLSIEELKSKVEKRK